MVQHHTRRRIYPYADRKGMSGVLLDMFGEFERPVVGYNYNLGGYKRWPKVSRDYYRITIHRLKKQGCVKEAQKGGKKFLKLTKKGKVQALLYKLGELKPQSSSAWDGKWRVVIFDISESGRRERDRIRWTLKKAGFRGLQKSVYIYPYGLPRELVDYLKESGLDRYIRFMRVDQLDEDKELRRRFKLQ